MNTTNQPQIVIVQIPKSPMMAAVLGFFFGPLGLLYVGFVPALIMLGVNIVVGAFTLGFGLFLTWPLCAMVGWSRANLQNKQLMKGKT
jgi:hypothetical protein